MPRTLALADYADRPTMMVVPVCEQTYFNTNWKTKEATLCPYDMLYHPPDYDPKSPRSDRKDSKIIRKNIWEQEYHKGIASTCHLQMGRPKWKPFDLPTMQYVRVQVKNEKSDTRLYNVIEWAVAINETKPSICDR